MTHILLVEDNPIDARLIRRMFQALKDWPNDVTWLDNGEKALSYLRMLENGRLEDEPALMLLDVNLPKCSGLDVLTAFRASRKNANLPVFLLSSTPVDVMTDLAASRNLTVDGYYEKPFGLPGFEAMARTIHEYCAHLPFQMQQKFEATQAGR